MTILIEIILYTIALFLTLWWFTVIILPIFYGMPKVIYLSLAKKELEPKAIFIYLISPILWTIVFSIAAFLMVWFTPSLVNQLYNSVGFFWGQWSGILFSLYRAFSKKGRKDLKEDFDDFTSRYLTKEGAKCLLEEGIEK